MMPPVPAVARVVLPELHAPPAVISCKVIVLPEHTMEGPVMLAGVTFTVTGLLTVHPTPSE